MTDNPSPPNGPANENIAADNVAPEAPAQPDRLAELAKSNTELKDQLLRTLAEMDNLRKRTEREVADARTYGIARFAGDVLAVADNFQRALDAPGPEWKAQADATARALVEGVELTERELLKVLEKHGVKRLEPQGQKFDPHLHQAMFEVPDTSVPAGTVVQVLQAGFVIGDRLLRPALVGVAKGGPKTSVAAEDQQPEPTSQSQN
jgi:molecular chaperone GrpE